jgi:hypothetical protein
MRALYSVLENGQLGLFESPTGTAQWVSAMSSNAFSACLEPVVESTHRVQGPARP